jgi:ABC-type nitrate/sulfonate/bicarbonate transport system ATPase subunit
MKPRTPRTPREPTPEIRPKPKAEAHWMIQTDLIDRIELALSSSAYLTELSADQRQSLAIDAASYLTSRILLIGS